VKAEKGKALHRMVLTMSDQRVYSLASTLLAESPELTAPHALRLAVLFAELFDQIEILRQCRELLAEESE
jgi:hypothetical protein